MNVSPYRLLETAVSQYDGTEQPLTPAAVAAHIDAPPAAVEEAFDRFVECELLVAAEDGFVPTITARELLELNLDGEFVVIDVKSRCS